MAIDQAAGFCRRCARPVLVQRPGTNHTLHLLVTLFLCGLWLPIWMLASVKIGGWRCVLCGRGARRSLGVLDYAVFASLGALGALVLGGWLLVAVTFR